MYWGTLKNHVVFALKHRLRVIVLNRLDEIKNNNNTKINSFLSEKFVFFKTWKFHSACFHICSAQRFVPLVSFQPIRRLLKWKERVCEFLAILKGDTGANKMPMGDAKLRNVKWFYGQTCMIFKIIGPKEVQVSFHRLVGQTLHGFFTYI